MRSKPALILTLLLAAFIILECLLPLHTAIQIGADEGFNLAKATLCLKGFKLYTQVWNDQPPLHTFLITQLLKHVSPSVLGPRLVTVAFAVLLLGSLFILALRLSGLFSASLATAMLIASPGFLELSSSCMLEIPALAIGTAALCVLLGSFGLRQSPAAAIGIPSQERRASPSSVVPLTKEEERRPFPYLRELLSGALFGAALQIKFAPALLLPLAALIVRLRHDQPMSTSAPLASGVENRNRPRPRPRPFPHRPPTLNFKPKTQNSPLLPLLVLASTLLLTFFAIDLLIDRGAYLRHFQQSWTSHFGAPKSFEYGSPSDHPFNWAILLKNWDATIPTLFCIWLFVRSDAPTLQRPQLFPLAWLALSVGFFALHKPWWNYYYIHIAIPLCWCAAIAISHVAADPSSIAVLRRMDVRRLKFKNQPSTTGPSTINSPNPLVPRPSTINSRYYPLALLLALYLLCAAPWMTGRLYLQAAAMRNSPQTYSSLILTEIQRFKPFTQWLYASDLIYSFHAGIPVPPQLAVVSLKRLWSGDMTAARIAAEVKSYRPGLILLRNDTREVPFQELLDTQYRLVYQDDRHRLYAHRTISKKPYESAN